LKWIEQSDLFVRPTRAPGKNATQMIPRCRCNQNNAIRSSAFAATTSLRP